MSIVAIVGRPNVGKSTFFNRLIQRREAIVDSVSGVTRDRHYGKSDWNGKQFSLIDTGGYVVGSDVIFEAEIDRQVELAIEEAEERSSPYHAASNAKEPVTANGAKLSIAVQKGM